MPQKPNARRRMDPSERGYVRVWLRGEHKTEIADAAKRSGMTISDYIWHLYQTRQPQG